MHDIFDAYEISRSDSWRAIMSSLARTPAFVAMLVLTFLLTGCASSPVRLPTYSQTIYSSPIASRLTSDEANDVTIYAISLVGTPYRYGGNTPDTGFDCSGLIGHVYLTRARIPAPRTVASLVNWGQPVAPDTVRTGDLVVFAQGGAATHAGIYVGAGRFVHAPSTGGEVRLDQLTSKYWSRQPVSFRRP